MLTFPVSHRLQQILLFVLEIESGQYHGHDQRLRCAAAGGAGGGSTPRNLEDGPARPGIRVPHRTPTHTPTGHATRNNANTHTHARTHALTHPPTR